MNQRAKFALSLTILFMLGTVAVYSFGDPPLLSNVESTYEGAISGTNASRLTLTFSNQIQRQYTDPTKVTLANAETGGDSFSLTPAEIAPTTGASPQPSNAEAVAFNLNYEHRNILAGWQKDKDIYVRLDAATVQDKDAKANVKADKGEKITWIYDNAGPRLLGTLTTDNPDFAPFYDSYTRDLTLYFDEAIRVQYVDDAVVTPVGAKVKIVTQNATVGAASQSVTLSLEERMSGQYTGQYSGTKTFRFKLTQANADEISGWRAGSIKVRLEAGAVEDIAKYPRGNDTYNKNIVDTADIPANNWTRDTTAPVLQSAVYSPDARRLSLRFNEAMSTNTADVTLSKIWVLSATASAPLNANTKDLTIEGNTIIIYVTATDKDQHTIIVNTVAPLARVETNAVKDRAGISNASESTVPIVKGSVKPVLRYQTTLKLTKGVNIISLSLKPDVPWTAKTIVKELGATIVIRALDGSFKAYAEGDIGEDFPIEANKGYIVNVIKPVSYTLVGTTWGEAVAAPPIETENPVWAFIVTGMIEPNIADIARIVNFRTCESTTAKIDHNGRFIAAFVDFSRRSVVEVDDDIELSFIDRRGNLLSKVIRRIEPEQIELAYLNTVIELRPTQSALLPNYPNPFNPETWIPYQIAQDAQVKIEIFNISGELIRLIDLGNQAAGWYVTKDKAAYWDGCNEIGEVVASGSYFYKLRAGDNYSAVRKMLIVK